MAIVVSKLTAGSNVHLTTSEEANGVYTDFVGQGVVGAVGNTSGVAPSTGGFSVNAQGTPDATIAVAAGVAYVTGTPTSQNSQTFRVKNSASANTTISANASGSTKYDWVYITLSATNLNTPNTAGDNVATITVSRSSSASADDGTPPTYGYNIAVVTVANGFTTITNGNIADKRAQVILATGSSNPAGGWTATSTPTTVTALGNRSYTVLFPSVDITGTVAVGMRLKFNRTVTAPTQCADLESSSSQYFSKTTPAGVTFTDDFTMMGWYKPESYVAGGIIARRNADVEGWSLGVNSSGQVVAWAGRIAGNNSSTTSYQSVPLNKQVHIAASVDLSGTSVLIYIDGVLVPSLTTITGTITALVQGTTALVVGAEKSAGTNPLDGELAQAAVFSSVLSATTIRSYMSQTLAGTESTNVSAYSLNNTLNDLNANANNLTAQGGATATTADTPFTNPVTGTSVTAGTTNYGIITAATFSTNTTLTVQVPEGGTIPTSGGVSAVSYSTQKVPYGMPIEKTKWDVSSIFKVQTATTSNATFGAFAAGGWQVIAPVGFGLVGYDLALFNVTTTTVYFNLAPVAPTGLAAGAEDTRFTSAILSPSAATMIIPPTTRRIPQTITTATTYILYTLGATTSAGVHAANSYAQLIAEFTLI